MAPSGSYAIGWSQVTLDGVPGADMAGVRTGLVWRWTGRAFRLDGPPGVLRLAEPPESQDLRRRARRGAGRIVPVLPDMAEPAPVIAGPAITVTDGRRSWQVALVPGGMDRGPWRISKPPRRRGVTCGLRVSTGPRDWRPLPLWPMNGMVWPPDDGRHARRQVPVERIVPGHAVLTPEGGTAVVAWTARRAVTGARFCAMPRLAPVRMGGVILAPDQGIVAEGAAARALFPGGPVSITARDAVDGRRVTRVTGLPGMVAHVITLARPGPYLAAGCAIDGSLPASLRRACPLDPGDALRRLTPGEVAILRGAPD